MCNPSDTKPARNGRVGSLHICLITMALLLAASTVQAQYSATATWNRNTDSNTAGYRLYYGSSTRNYPWSIDVGNQTSAPLNLSPGGYYFAVRAYNAAYQYGPLSAEVYFTVGTPTAAIQASLQSSTSVRVTWQTTNAIAVTLNGQIVPLNGSTTSPISATTTFTIRAVSSTGQAATASTTVASSIPPLAPLNLAATVSGSRATFSWQRNPAGGIPEEYLLFIATTESGLPVTQPLVGNVLSSTASLPAGTYYARVRARNSAGSSNDSNVITVLIRR